MGKLSAIEEAHVIHLQPGDVFILHIDQRLSYEELERVAGELERSLVSPAPRFGVPFIVLCAGIEFSVLRSAKSVTERDDSGQEETVL